MDFFDIFDGHVTFDENAFQHTDIFPAESFNFDTLDPIMLEQRLSYLNSTLCDQSGRFGNENALNEVFPYQPTTHHTACIDTGIDPSLLLPNNSAGAERSVCELDILTNHWITPTYIFEQQIHYQRDDANDSASRWSCSGPYDNCSGRTAGPGRLFGGTEHCHVKDCTSGPFQSMCDFQLHLQEHSNTVSPLWKEGQPCPWPRCTSKATFKTRAVFQTHLDNIHVNPLLCSAKGCTHKKPFRSNSELQRHMQTAHPKGELPYKCPYSECKCSPRQFARRDKWLQHIRKGHDEPMCPLNHCEAGMRYAFATRAELIEHIKKYHGNYECGIGSCSQKSQSRFSEFELFKHLEFHHDIQGKDLATARNAANAARDRTVRPSHLPDPVSCMDCRFCRKEQAGCGARGNREVIIVG